MTEMLHTTTLQSKSHNLLPFHSRLAKVEKRAADHRLSVRELLHLLWLACNARAELLRRIPRFQNVEY